MDIPLTQRRTDEFDERNVVLWLTLGASSFGDTLDELLRRHSRPAPASAVARTAEDEALTDLVLGLVALRRRLQVAIERACVAPDPDRDAVVRAAVVRAESAAAVELEDLLR